VEFLSFSHCLYWKDGKGATPEETFYTILSSYSSLFSTIPSGKIPSILQDIGTEIEGVVWGRGADGRSPRKSFGQFRKLHRNSVCVLFS